MKILFTFAMILTIPAHAASIYCPNILSDNGHDTTLRVKNFYLASNNEGSYQIQERSTNNSGVRQRLVNRLYCQFSNINSSRPTALIVGCSHDHKLFDVRLRNQSHNPDKMVLTIYDNRTGETRIIVGSNCGIH